MNYFSALFRRYVMADLNALSAKIDDLKQHVDDAKARDAQLQTQVTKLQGQVTDLQQQVANLPQTPDTQPLIDKVNAIEGTADQIGQTLAPSTGAQ